MNNKSKNGVYALDIFIVVLLVFSIIGAAVRAFYGSGMILSGDADNYYVSYVICNTDSNMTGYFSEGAVFYTEDGEEFGSLVGDATSTPARIYTQNGEGKFITTYSDTHFDLTGTFSVSGEMKEQGFLCGSSYLAPNMTVKISRSGVTAEILITDITKAS